MSTLKTVPIDQLQNSQATTQVTTVPNVQVIINQAPPAASGALERNHLTALLLAIFLGWLGIDRFYLGNAGVGILKFLTGGLFGILWIIDIIMIATKSVKGVGWVK